MATTIEISHRNQAKFLKYIQKNFAPYPLNNFNIHIEANNTSVITPHNCEFAFKDASTGMAYDVCVREEGSAQSDGNGHMMYYVRVKISQPDGDIEGLKALVTTALTHVEDGDASLVSVFNSKSKYGYWSESDKINAQDIDYIFLPKDIKDGIVADIGTFMASHKRYKKFGRAHKICYLLTGVPGSGKTSLIKSLAKKYGRAIYILSFSKHLDDDMLLELIGCIKENSILILEDIDAFFVDREAKDINISFSAFINILDGATKIADGTLIFLTANNPERLDPALIRPGRVDKIVKFDPPRRQEIHDAFVAMIEGPGASASEGAESPSTPNATFDQFYKYISKMSVSMAGVVDYLFQHPVDYMDHLDDLAKHTKLIHEISNCKNDTMYK